MNLLTHFRRTHSLSPLFATGSALALLLASSGCHEDNLVENKATDNDYIRLPGQKTETLAASAGSLFPLHPGNQWNLIVQTGKQSQGTEQMVDVGTMTIGGVTGEVLEMRRGGKAYREEVYRNSPAGGVLMVASGAKGDLMEMSPPIPLFQIPLVEGGAVSWNGILHFKNSSSPAGALSRVTGHELIRTPAGEFTAYRIDTIITTTINGQAAAFPVKRWLAPGIGVVQQQMMAGSIVMTKQLQNYTVAKK